mmetsp:Transcript_41311/g.108489  ORF Transcript_41311/g.108489 Transcript_41311/m.108489 type:complete len:580 (-) Transcript_41311:24-1763(-)
MHRQGRLPSPGISSDPFCFYDPSRSVQTLLQEKRRPRSAWRYVPSTPPAQKQWLDSPGGRRSRPATAGTLCQRTRDAVVSRRPSSLPCVLGRRNVVEIDAGLLAHAAVPPVGLRGKNPEVMQARPVVQSRPPSSQGWRRSASLINTSLRGSSPREFMLAPCISGPVAIPAGDGIRVGGASRRRVLTVALRSAEDVAALVNSVSGRAVVAQVQVSGVVIPAKSLVEEALSLSGGRVGEKLAALQPGWHTEVAFRCEDKEGVWTAEQEISFREAESVNSAVRKHIVDALEAQGSQWEVSDIAGVLKGLQVPADSIVEATPLRQSSLALCFALAALRQQASQQVVSKVVCEHLRDAHAFKTDASAQREVPRVNRRAMEGPLDVESAFFRSSGGCTVLSLFTLEGILNRLGVVEAGREELYREAMRLSDVAPRGFIILQGFAHVFERLALRLRQSPDLLAQRLASHLPPDVNRPPAFLVEDLNLVFGAFSSLSAGMAAVDVTRLFGAAHFFDEHTRLVNVPVQQVEEARREVQGWWPALTFAGLLRLIAEVARRSGDEPELAFHQVAALAPVLQSIRVFDVDT